MKLNDYDPDDYQVISIRTKDDVLMSARISVRGAEFIIRRVFTHGGEFCGKPTKIFEFDKLGNFVDGDYEKEYIEIGWNNAPAGLSKIGKELGLDYVMPSGIFSSGYRQPHYVDEELDRV